MEKPIILEINDFNKELAELVNKYSQTLPMSVIQDKIIQLQPVLSQIAEKQLKEAEEQYKEESEKEDTNGR